MPSDDSVQAVILAAGEGTRLRPLTNNKPKAMVRIHDTPLLSYVMDFLLDTTDISDLIVVTGYKGDRIREYYGDAYRDTPIHYRYQHDALGLAHALLQTEDIVTDDQFIVALGDLVFSPTTNLDEFHATRRDTDGALLTEHVPEDEASRYGVLDVDDNDGIIDLVEKPDNPPTTQIISGIYALPRDIYRACHYVDPSDRGEYELTDAIRHLITDKEDDGTDIRAIPMSNDEWRIDVGYPEDQDEAEHRLE